MKQAARDAVELVLGHIQRRLDAPKVFSPASLDPSAPLRRTSQAAEPLSFEQARERLIGVFGEFGSKATHVLTDQGHKIALKPRARRRVGAMSDPSDRAETDSLPEGHLPKKRRQPATINIRPGRGGARRRLEFERDPAEGLERFANIVWWPVPGPGTMLGLIECASDGNTVAVCRLSGEDRDDTLIDQVDKALALEAGNPERLRIRYILLALDMSGLREVRPPRALPAPAHILERDDIVLFERWVKEGWVEHAIWRDGRRIARDVLPAEMILRILRDNRVNLWLSSYGRAIDWNSDRLGIRALNLVSAEDRDNIDRTLQEARLRKGPFAGKGWRNSPPRFGFSRQPKTLELVEDDEQWPWIHRAFELADMGESAGGGFSSRAVTKALADEGCPFDHERVRQILKDPIYATGEWFVNVGGIPVAQHPLSLKNPVPLDRFLRVQAKLELRQGSTKRTPLGEFLFNYVESHHKQCAGAVYKNGIQVLVKGYVEAGREDQRRMKHTPCAPKQCVGRGRSARGSFLWERAELQDPVVVAMRELVEHPELLAQAQLAARHQIAEGTARLTDDQREQLERELTEICQREEAAAEEWVDRAVKDSSVGIDEYQRVAGVLKRRKESIERRLSADQDAARAANGSRQTPGSVEELKRAFLEILTVETPTDPLMLQLRARLFQILVSRIVIDDDGDPDKPIVVTVEGHLVPPTGEGAASPLVAARELLESYLASQEGKLPEAERRLAQLEETAEAVAAQAPDVETAYEYKYHKAVSTLSSHFFGTSGGELKRLRRRRLDATGWGLRKGSVREDWVPAWILDIVISRPARLLYAQGSATEALLVDTLQRLGEACASALAAETSLALPTVRSWLKDRTASGVVVQARPPKGPRPALYRVVDRSRPPANNLRAA